MVEETIYKGNTMKNIKITLKDGTVHSLAHVTNSEIWQEHFLRIIGVKNGKSAEIIVSLADIATVEKVAEQAEPEKATEKTSPEKARGPHVGGKVTLTDEFTAHLISYYHGKSVKPSDQREIKSILTEPYFNVVCCQDFRDGRSYYCLEGSRTGKLYTDVNTNGVKVYEQ